MPETPAYFLCDYSFAIDLFLYYELFVYLVIFFSLDENLGITNCPLLLLLSSIWHQNPSIPLSKRLMSQISHRTPVSPLWSKPVARFLFNISAKLNVRTCQFNWPQMR